MMIWTYISLNSDHLIWSSLLHTAGIDHDQSSIDWIQSMDPQ